MAIVRKLRILAPKEIYKRCRMEWSRCKVVFWSLFYNDHCNFSYVMDTMMEPMIRFVDNYVKYLGPAFVGFLIGMMGMVITLLYLVVVPYEWHRKSWFEIGFYIIIGHWILVNVLFHYYAAYTTQPGFPPVGSIVIEVVGMCKHCIAPKPPRTHHCRVCNRCILKMDHHCPWMNQCVGHFNHRYFFFTMFFLWLGCVFIVIGMWPSFMEHYWREQGQVAPWCLMMNEKLFYAGYLCQGLDEIHSSLDKDSHGSPDLSGTTSWPALASQMGKAARTCILVVFFTSAAVVMALGPLTIWHMRLIARGETSIEQHINKQMRQRFEKEGKVYVNPYDFGVWGNVKRFLDLNGPDRSFWLHILLPSWRKPVGNGLTWESATFEIRHDLKADDIEAAKRALENGPENGEVVESLVCM